MEESDGRDGPVEADASARVRDGIVAAAAEEIAAASLADLLSFLTPSLLADSSRSADRTWSASTVRYRFRHAGLSFDREALADGLVSHALAELREALDGWAARAEERIAAAEVAELERALAEGLAELAAAASNGLRVRGLPWPWVRVLALGAATGADTERGPVAAEAVALVEAASLRVAAALSAQAGIDFLSHERGARAGSQAALRAILIGLVSGATAARGPVHTLAAELLAALQPPPSALRPPPVAPAEDLAHGPQNETPDEVAVRVGRLLDAGGLASPTAAALLDELVAALPSSSSAFSQGRRRLQEIVANRALRESPRLDRLWRTAAEVLSMADGDRALAEEAATAALYDEEIGRTPASLAASVRTGWLLLRLERYEEGVLHLQRVRRTAARVGATNVAAAAEAYAVYAACFTGPLEAPPTLAARLREAGLSGSWGQLATALADAAAVRAHLLRGEIAAADAVLEGAPRLPTTDMSMGSTHLQLSLAWRHLAAGEVSEALRQALAVRDRLRRLRVSNPAAWPWLEPTVVALVRLRRAGEARRLIDEAEAHAIRWGTPTVVAELQRARALVAADAATAERLMAAAASTLERSGARIERARSELAVAAIRREPPPADPAGVHPASPLVTALVAVSRPPGGMSPRARAVALLVGRGLRNREIAGRLGITVSTVSRHVSSAMRAVGASSRTELALLASAWPDEPEAVPSPAPAQQVEDGTA